MKCHHYYSDETSSLPIDSMRPLFEQIEILSGIQIVYSDCKYILYIYLQPSMMASSGFCLWAKALRGHLEKCQDVLTKIGQEEGDCSLAGRKPRTRGEVCPTSTKKNKLFSHLVNSYRARKLKIGKNTWILMVHVSHHSDRRLPFEACPRESNWRFKS